MTTKVIPERKVTTCDCCGVECQGSNFVHEGKLALRRAGLDFQGCPVADATVRMDLCDRCNDKIAHAINAACTSIRAGQPQGGSNG